MHDDDVTDDRARWNGLVQALHWLTAILLLVLAYTGFFGMPAAGGNLHATLGVMLLVVMVLRLAARVLSRPPAVTKSSLTLIAGGVQMLLYAGVFALIVSGPLSVARSPFAPPVMVFGSVPLPALHWVPARLGWFAHKWSGYGLLALVLLHVAGTVRHHVGGNRSFVYRMLPWSPKP